MCVFTLPCSCVGAGAVSSAVSCPQRIIHTSSDLAIGWFPMLWRRFLESLDNNLRGWHIVRWSHPEAPLLLPPPTARLLISCGCCKSGGPPIAASFNTFDAYPR